MIIQDIKGDFYSKIKGKRVLIVVNYDIDAICACKILQSLFKTDYTLYTLVPVDVTTDLKASIRENRLDEKFIIFINCGGTIDLVGELLLEEGITLFVLDSHRPLDVCNIYNPHQVKLLSKPDVPVPDFQDIFSEDSDEEENSGNENEENENENEVEDDDDDDGGMNITYNEDDLGDPQSKRRRLIEKGIRRRKNNKMWQARRERLLFNYSQFSGYGKSSALIMYELAWKMSKDSFDLLWYGIVGLSEQLLMRKISEHEYVNECADVQNHVARLNHKSSQLSREKRNTGVRIDFDKDLRLALVRHWTVKSSLTYSTFTATRLHLWTFQGEKRLHEMLAEIGIPLMQCNQKFGSMDLMFRQEFHQSLEKMTGKYSLEGIVFLSFFIQHGFRAKYSASDFVYSLLALLQSHSDERPKSDCFLECLEALCRTKKEKLDQGIDLAKKLLMSIFKQVQTALEMKQFQCSGPYLYLPVPEGNADPILCNHPYGILLLAEFALRAFLSSTSVLRYKNLPLLISTPCIRERGLPATETEEVLCHLTGIAPLTQQNNSSFFGNAFQKVATTVNISIREAYFDSSVIQINLNDRQRFVDALSILLSSDD